MDHRSIVDGVTISFVPPSESSRRAAHAVAFCQTDRFLVNRVASFLDAGLAAGEHVIVLATPRHWNSISSHLEEVDAAETGESLLQ